MDKESSVGSRVAASPSAQPLERMIGRRAILLAAAVGALASCGAKRDTLVPGSDDEGQVIRIVVEDFGRWKGATFGNLEGKIALEPTSIVEQGTSVSMVLKDGGASLNSSDDQLVRAYLEKNESPLPVASLLSGSAWAIIGSDLPDLNETILPPAGIKAYGSISRPGFSTDGQRALVRLRHTWSIHNALVTYVLSREGGVWRVAARYQRVQV